MAPPPEVVELTEAFVLEKHCTGGSEIIMCPSSSVSLFFSRTFSTAEPRGARPISRFCKKYQRTTRRCRTGIYGQKGEGRKKVEETFGIGGFGYPAALLYSPKKNAYSVLKAGLDYKHSVEFIDSLRHGFEKVTQIDGSLADVETTIPRDGKDATEELKDEIDLEDIVIEEL